MTRVIHTGDTHIGYRQYHSPERRADFLAAFEHVVEDAIDADVDALVHAGDLFHDTRPDLEDLMGTITVLRRLANADIPFLGVVGNHEGTRDRQWIDLFEGLELAHRLDAGGHVVGDVTFYGLDYVPPTQRSQLNYQFDLPDTERTALVAHGLFEPFAHADWDTEALLESANVDVDVLLLGDNHTPGQAEINDTWVTYCGSTERTSAAEREARGYNLVTFDEEVRIARRTIEDTRPFRFVDVSLGTSDGAEYAIDEVLAHDVAEAVVIVSLEGAGEEIRPAVIEEAVSARGALVVRVIDRRELTDGDAQSTQVQFADPDEAVTERARQIGISPAGQLVDAMVRDPSILDSNVRDRVQSRIQTLLEEEPEAFTSADPESPPNGIPKSGDAQEGDEQASMGEFL